MMFSSDKDSAEIEQSTLKETNSNKRYFCTVAYIIAVLYDLGQRGGLFYNSIQQGLNKTT